MSSARLSEHPSGELLIYIRPDEQGGKLSLYHVGLGLIAIQRLLNRALESDVRAQQQLQFLTPQERADAIALTIENVKFASVDIKGIVGAALQGTVSLFRDTTVSVVAGVITHILVNVAHINERTDTQIEIDQSLLPSLEELARVGVVGRFVYDLEHGDVRCHVDRETYEKVRQLRNQERRQTDRVEVGTVVGSNMLERRIEIRFETFGGAVVPCYYYEEDADRFRKFTRDGVQVEVKGDPIWAGSEDRFEPPDRFQIRDMKRVTNSRH